VLRGYINISALLPRRAEGNNGSGNSVVTGLVPSTKLSATICAFCSAVQLRVRPVPVNTSNRRTGSGLDLCKSSVSDTCLTRSTQQSDNRRLTYGDEGGV